MPAIRQLSRWLLGRILPTTESWSEMAVLFTDHDGIIPVNRSCFSKNGVTDVLSLTYTPATGNPGRFSGEIVVNAEMALEKGPSHDGCTHELALYIAHGIHHLAGASDRTPALRSKMLRQERAWVREAAQNGLLEKLDSPIHPCTRRAGKKLP